MCWRNVWMIPKGPQIITHGMHAWRRAELFSCGFLLYSWAIFFFSFLPHLDTNFRSRSPLGPFSNFHVIALLTFEAKTISLLVWYAQTLRLAPLWPSITASASDLSSFLLFISVHRNILAEWIMKSYSLYILKRPQFFFTFSAYSWYVARKFNPELI